VYVPLQLAHATPLADALGAPSTAAPTTTTITTTQVRPLDIGANHIRTFAQHQPALRPGAFGQRTASSVVPEPGSRRVFVASRNDGARQRGAAEAEGEQDGQGGREDWATTHSARPCSITA
jgi:hypothetical protein